MAVSFEVQHDGNDVFISYAHVDAKKDQLTAENLSGWLRSLGYDVWWDRSLLAGDCWLEALVQKAFGAKRVIVLWSPQAAKRDWVLTEARIGAGFRKLVPLVIEDHPFPAEWGHVQYKKIENFEAEKDYILEALRLEPSRVKARDAKDDARVSIAALPTGSGVLIGRDAELAMLLKAWASTAPHADPAEKTNVFVLHAIGGAGKTALMRQFVDGLADTDFAGAYKVFSWSAYSQGSGDNKTANADEVIASALGFFGHDLSRHPLPDPVERGRKLAHLVGERRSLLILDGLEPLQDLPLVNGGRLKDRGLAALIKELAAQNKGLVVITSRQELPELAASKRPRVISHALDRLDKEAAVALLAHLGVHGKRTEMEKAVEDVLGHALSLNLLGTYLDAVYGGDVNQREHFKLGEIEDAPADFVGDQTARYAKRAARIMEGTIARFEAMEGRATDGAETAILHIVGLFDRPAEKAALDALLAEPAIPGLTDAFHSLSVQPRRARWNVTVDRLRKLRLLNAADPREPGNLDAHPIVRAHFGSRLQYRAPEAFREAHSRLYDFYRYQDLPQAFQKPEAYGLLALLAGQRDHKEIIVNQIKRGNWPRGWLPQMPPNIVHPDWTVLQDAAALVGTAAFDDLLRKFLSDDLKGMRPCFSAIAHGCAADRCEEAYYEVYLPRVLRGNEAFINSKLGALNANLAALASFFDQIWGTPCKGLREVTKAHVLGAAAFALRALGRLGEAIAPLVACLKADIVACNWENAARSANNISLLQLTLGNVGEAIVMAKTSVAYAEPSGGAGMRVISRTTLADALHQAGQAREASKHFEEAEAMQAAMPEQPLKLYSVQGYQYCDLLLAQGQAKAVVQRAKQSLKSGKAWYSLLSTALDNLSFGRACASKIIPTKRSAGQDSKGRQGLERSVGRTRLHLDAAMEGLRRSSDEMWISRGLLARAAFRRAMGAFDAAETDLREAHEIAERGEMRLDLTDYHFESARLLLTQIGAEPEAAEGKTMRARAEEHYAAAKKLIKETGYKRRLPELDAICACLDGEIPALILDPDRDRNGRPAAEHH